MSQSEQATPEQVAEVRKAIDLTYQINSLFKDQSLAVTGAVLSTLVANWLAAHPIDNDEERNQQFTRWMTTVMHTMKKMAERP